MRMQWDVGSGASTKVGASCMGVISCQGVLAAWVEGAEARARHPGEVAVRRASRRVPSISASPRSDR